MKYRNIRTGAVIEINSVLSGKNWEAVKDRPPAASTRKLRKKKEAAE